MVKDPVCGMMVDPQSPPATIVFRGTKYFFCTEQCKKQFQQDPQKYLGKAQQGNAKDDKKR